MSSLKHIRPSGIRLSKVHELWIYGIFSGLLFSGIGWLIFHYFLMVHGQFGEEHHPLEAWFLKMHGAATMGFLIVLGTLMPIHIQRGWQLRRNYRTGISMLVLVSILVLTGYGLYYASNEELRPAMSAIHWVIGLIATLGLGIHIYFGKRKYHVGK